MVNRQSFLVIDGYLVNLVFLGVNLLSREGNSQTGDRKASNGNYEENENNPENHSKALLKKYHSESIDSPKDEFY